MAENNNETLAHLRKKYNSAVTAQIANGLVMGVAGGAAVVAALMGATAEIVSEGVMSQVAGDVVKTSAYQATISEKKQSLLADFSAGKISYEEFKSAYETLFSTDAVIEYSKTAGDEKLTQTVDDYKESKEVSDTMFGKGVPMFLGTMAVSCVGLVVTNSIEATYRKRLETYKAQMQEQEMID